MNKNDLSIATITWARSKDEEELLKASLLTLAQLQIHVFVTDGGSSDSFIQFMRSIEHFKVFTTPIKGVWPQAKSSLQEAFQQNTPFILYTEPDKLDFFKHSLNNILTNVAVNEQTGIVTASRNAQAFSTFPAFQQMTETTINNCCAEVIGSNIDYTYGPFIVNRNLVPYLQNLPNDIGWGWRPYCFCIAAALHYRVDYFEGNFACPADEQHDTRNERLYRMRQLSQNINGITLSAEFRQ